MKLALILPPCIMATGLIIGWLWLRTQNIWIVTLAHGALNSWGQYAFRYMPDSAVPNPADLQVLLGGTVAMLLVGSLLLWLAVDSDQHA